MTTGGTAGGPVRLRAPERRLDPRAMQWWQARCAAATLAPTVALVIAGALTTRLLFVAAAVCAVAGGTAATTLPRRWYQRQRWEVTDRVVFTRTGYLRTTWQLTPVDLVRTADTRTGPLQRAFGLATLVLTTSSNRPVEVAGLGNELAVEMARRLSDHSARLRGAAR